MLCPSLAADPPTPPPRHAPLRTGPCCPPAYPVCLVPSHTSRSPCSCLQLVPPTDPQHLSHTVPASPRLPPAAPAPLQAKVIVFVSTCKQVRFLYEAFRKLRPGVPLRALHGRMNQYKRMGGEASAAVGSVWVVGYVSQGGGALKLTKWRKKVATL